MHDDLATTTNGNTTVATATIIGTDNGGNLAVAILDQSSIQQTSPTTQIILTTESTSFSSISTSRNSLHQHHHQQHQLPPPPPQQSQHFNLINNGLRQSHQILGGSISNNIINNNVIATSTPSSSSSSLSSSSSTHVIVQATSINSSASSLINGDNIDINDNNGIIIHHHHHNGSNHQQSHHLQHHNNDHINLITTSSSLPSSSSIVPNGTVLVAVSSASNSADGGAVSVTNLDEQNPATTTSSINNNNNSEILQIITIDQSFNDEDDCDDDDDDDDDDPMHIDLKGGMFNDVTNEGYQDNSSTVAIGGAIVQQQQQQQHQQQQTSVGTIVNATSAGYIPLMTPVIGGGVGVNINGTNPCDQTDLKSYFEELCPVCGDKVSGYHYGLLTCESCKGFFKRTVQNKKVYTCVAERQCHIDKTQRKRCPYCRFQKCLEVGMKLEAVRADRMRGGRNKFGPMYKRDRARKLQIMRQRQLALQALRASEGGNPSQLSPTGYQQPYSHMNIKQEIQIPQISSLTSSSPDSSPSPIAIALGQVSASGTTTAISLGSIASGSCGSGGGGGGGGGTVGGSSSGGSNVAGGNSGTLGTSNLTTTQSGTSVQNTSTDSKLWFANSTTASPHSLSPKQFSFDTGTNPTSTEDTSTVEPLSKKQYWKNSKSLNFPRVSPMIREFVQTVDDREWQTQLFSLLQSQSYNQCEVDLFELMCKVLDQNLFSQVDWARNTVFFKDLKVDDQMKLLQNSWSDMLVLDHLHQRIHNSLPDETTLHNGQKFDLLGLGLLGVPQLSDHFNELQNKLQELKFDVGDYICMKFLLLLNPEVRGITNRKTVEEGYGNVQAALLDYTLTCYPSVTDKFSKLRSIIPEIHAMAARGEEHLYLKHCAGSAPTQTLLMEMLHAKRK